jgi:uncharacterized repeat protein (TIGR03847 family)
MSADLGSVRVLGADAIGQPGQRQFRLFAESVRGTVLLWVEKEQLESLSIALDRSLAFVSEGQILRMEARSGEHPVPEGMPGDFPRTPNYEFQVGRMQLNYDERESLFELIAIPIEILMERGQEPQLLMQEEEAISFFFTPQQAQELSSTILSVISAGRPLCPLCRTPLDGGPHACVKQNGHHKIIPLDEEGEG